MLKEVRDLKHNQQKMPAENKDLQLNQQKILAENSALNKEVERLRYLEQLRSVQAPASTSAAAPVVKPLLPPGSASQQRVCFACNNPGHMAKNCAQNSATRNAVNHSRGPRQIREAYLRVAIGDQTYDCLLYTGSKVSLFPRRVVGSALIGETSGTLKAANESAQYPASGTDRCFPVTGGRTGP